MTFTICDEVTFLDPSANPRQFRPKLLRRRPALLLEVNLAATRRSLNGESFGQTMIQLSGSSLALDVCLLFAYNRDRLSHSLDACVLVAALVHFFSLSTLMWSILAAHCLRAAAMDDERRVTDNCSALCKRLLLAWGNETRPSGRRIHREK